MNVDPSAKQRLLSGTANIMMCPSCGYQGPIDKPIVYHDPDKELLLTFFPPRPGMQLNDQERLIAPFMTQIMNNLPAEKRKAYLLRPQTMLTMETLMEKILEADGITREMIDDQQKKLALLQRLLSLPDEASLDTVIAQEESLIDQSFFGILSRIAETAIAQGDRNTAEGLAVLQQKLLTSTKFGKELQEQVKESEEAVKSLQEASKEGLTREKLLDLIIEAPTETRLSSLVNMTRSGMDYEFFQILSTRIETASGEEKTSLEALRTKLLEMTKAIDDALAEEMNVAKKNLETLLKAPDLETAITQNPQIINEFFVEAVKTELEKARSEGNLERSGNLQKIMDVFQQLSKPPAEIAFVEDLIRAETADARQNILKSNSEKVTPEFLQVLNQLIGQSETENQPAELKEKIQEILSGSTQVLYGKEFFKIGATYCIQNRAGVQISTALFLFITRWNYLNANRVHEL